jgi:hypothetical protein
MSKDNQTMLVALALGVYLLSKRPAVAAAQPRPGGNLTSLPGNIGTGAGQVLGGALGGMLQNLFGGSSTSYVPNGGGATVSPDWDAAYQQNSELLDNVTLYGV